MKDLTMNQLHQQPLQLVVRAKIDLERAGYSENGPTVRYTAVRSAPYSLKQANEGLLAQL